MDSLRAPIPGDLPAEEPPQDEAAYDRVREARSRADWSEAADLCVEDLRNGARDLQFAAWLTEAWLHLYGFNGLAHGLETIADLCESHWGELQPAGDDSFEDRLTSIGWVNENLPAVVRRLVQEQLRQSALPDDTPVYEHLLNDLESAAHTAAKLEVALNERCGERAPRLEELTAMLHSMRKQVASILGRREPESAEPATQDLLKDAPVENAQITSTPLVEDSAPAVAPPAAPPAGSASDSSRSGCGPIRTRNDAYRLLADAADFLTRTDPHSPVPLLVRRAIAWGDMPLTELVADMIRHDGDRSEINRLLGVNKPKS